MRRASRTFLICAALAAGGAVAVVPADGTVPPKNCGKIKVKGKRYTVKADQVSCKFAEKWTRVYLERRRPARGYRCERYRNSYLVFQCRRSYKTYMAQK